MLREFDVFGKGNLFQLSQQCIHFLARSVMFLLNGQLTPTLEGCLGSRGIAQDQVTFAD